MKGLAKILVAEDAAYKGFLPGTVSSSKEFIHVSQKEGSVAERFKC